MRIWKQAWVAWPPILRRAWPWLVFSLSLDLFCEFLADSLNKMDSHYFLIGVTLTVSISLLLSVFGIILINQMVYDLNTGKTSSLVGALKENTKHVFIESTRAFVPIILKSLLFVIPGILEAIRLYWVPFVVQFDGEYKRGKVDALKQSRQLVLGNTKIVAGALIITTILSMFPRLWLGSVDALKHPGLFGLLFFVTLSMELYGDIVLFCLYEELVNIKLRGAHGNSISV